MLYFIYQNAILKLRLVFDASSTYMYNNKVTHITRKLIAVSNHLWELFSPTSRLSDQQLTQST